MGRGSTTREVLPTVRAPAGDDGTKARARLTKSLEGVGVRSFQAQGDGRYALVLVDAATGMVAVRRTEDIEDALPLVAQCLEAPLGPVGILDLEDEDAPWWDIGPDIEVDRKRSYAGPEHTLIEVNLRTLAEQVNARSAGAGAPLGRYAVMVMRANGAMPVLRTAHDTDAAAEVLAELFDDAETWCGGVVYLADPVGPLPVPYRMRGAVVAGRHYAL